MTRDCISKISATAAARFSGITDGIEIDQFLTDERTFGAVMRNLEVIGEAAKRVPEEVKRRHTKVEWRKIAGFRDVAIHAYPTIDEEIDWDIVQHKIPELAAQIEQIIAGE